MKQAIDEKLQQRTVLHAKSLRIFRNFSPEIRYIIFEFYFSEDKNWTWVWGDQWDPAWDNEHEGASPDYVYRLHTTALITTFRTADHELYHEVSQIYTNTFCIVYQILKFLCSRSQ